MDQYVLNLAKLVSNICKNIHIEEIVYQGNHLFIYADTSINSPFPIECQNGSYLNSDYQCSQCDQSCQQCTYDQFNLISQHCTVCAKNYYYDLVKMECTPTCGEGKRINNQLNICEKCAIQDCAQCQDDIKQCSKCNNSFLLANNVCIYQGQEDLIFQKYLSILMKDKVCKRDDYSQDRINNLQEKNSFETNQKQICYDDLITCPVINNQLYNQDQFYIYSLADEVNQRLYLFTQYKIQTYSYPQLDLLFEGKNILPNMLINQCGFVNSDQVYFYCSYGQNIIIKYKRDSALGTMQYKFQGKVAFINYQGQIFLNWECGRIPTIGQTFIQILNINNNSTQTISLPKGKQFRYLEVNELQFCYEVTTQVLYFLNSTQKAQNNSNINIASDRFSVLKTNISIFFDIFVVEETNFYILSNSLYYCYWSLVDQQNKNISFSSCQVLNMNQVIPFFQIISTSSKDYYSKEKILITFSRLYSTLFIFDLKLGWDKINIIFDRTEFLVQSYYFTDGCIFYVVSQGLMSAYCLKQIDQQQVANQFDYQNILVSQSLWDFSGIDLYFILYKFPELIVVNSQEVLIINLLSYNKTQQNQATNNSISKADILKNFLTFPTYEITNQIGYLNVINQSKVVSSHFIFKVQDLDATNSQMKQTYKFLVIIESFNIKAIYLQGNKSYSQSVVRLRNDLGAVIDSSYLEQLQIIILWYTQIFQIIDSISLNLIYQSQIYDKQGISQPNSFRMLQSSDYKYLTIIMIDQANQQALLTILYFDQIGNEPDEKQQFYISYNQIQIENYMVAIIFDKNMIYTYNIETKEENSQIVIQDKLIQDQAIFTLSPSCSLIGSYFNSTFYFQKLDNSNQTFSYQLNKQLSVQSFVILKRFDYQNLLVVLTDTEIILFSWFVHQEFNQNLDFNQEQVMSCVGKKEIIYPTDDEIAADDSETISNFLYVKSDGQLICIVNLMDDEFVLLKRITSKVYINGINILKRQESFNEQEGIQIQKADIIAIKGLSSTYLYSRDNESDNFQLYFQSQISCMNIGFLLNELICKNGGQKDTYLFPLFKSPFLIKYDLESEGNFSYNRKIDHFSYLPHKQIIIMKSSYKKFKSVYLNTKQEITFFQTPDIQFSYFGDQISQPEQDLFSGYYYDEATSIFITIKQNSNVSAYKVSEDGQTLDFMYSFKRNQILCMGLISKKNYLLFWLPQTNSLLCFDFVQGKVIIETLSLTNQNEKSKKLFDYNDEFLYVQIYQSVYKFSFKTGQIVSHIVMSTLKFNQFVYFSQIYVDPKDNFLILLNQMDIVLIKMNTQELEYRRFQNEPEFFNPNILRQLNVILLIPVSSSIAYFFKLPGTDIQASNIQIYKTDVLYSIYTQYVDIKNQIMCILTVDSVIHFIDLSQIKEVSASNSSMDNQKQNSSGDNQSNEEQNSIDDDNWSDKAIDDDDYDDIPQVNPLKEYLSFSLHELLEDLVNSNGQENPLIFDNLSLVLYYEQDIFFISFLNNIYTYSISKKQVVFIIRYHSEPIIKLQAVNDLLLLSGDSSGVYLWSIEEIIKYKFLDLTMRSLQNIVYNSNYIQQESSFTFYNQEKGQLFIIDKQKAEIQKRIQIQQEVYTQNFYSSNSWQILNRNQGYFSRDGQLDQNSQAILVISLGNDFLFFNQQAQNVGDTLNLSSFKQIIGFSNGNMYFLSQKNNLYACQISSKIIKPISKIRQNFQIIENYLQKNLNDIIIKQFSKNMFTNFSTFDSIEENQQVFLVLENGVLGVIDYRADPFSSQSNFEVIQFFDLNSTSTKNIISCMQISSQYIVLLNNLSEILLLKYIPQTNSPDDSKFVIVKVFNLTNIQFNNIEFDAERQRLFVFSSINEYIYLLNFIPYTVDEYPSPEPSTLFQKISMVQPSNNLNRFLISNSGQYYIIFSSLYIKIYYAQDFKLKTEIMQVYCQSEIQNVKILSQNILYVQAQTEILIYVLQDVFPFYYISHNICFTYPHLYHFTIQRSSEDSPILNLQLYLQSQQGFTRLQLPIDITQINYSQRLRNLYLAQYPQPNCQKSELFEIKQQLTAKVSISDQDKSSILNLFKYDSSQNQGNGIINSSKVYDCLLSFSLEYTTKNYNYIKNLYLSILQINYKSIQKYTPLTIKIKVKESSMPQSLDIFSSLTYTQDSQILVYSKNKLNCTILLNQNTKLIQSQGSSLFLYNLTFLIDSQTQPFSQNFNKSNQFPQQLGNSSIDKSIIIQNKNRLNLYCVRFIKQNDQFQVNIQNVSLSIIDDISFKDYLFSFQNLSSSQAPFKPNGTIIFPSFSTQQNWVLYYNQTQSFIQFTQLGILKISNMLIENVTNTMTKPFLFHAEGISQVTIANITDFYFKNTQNTFFMYGDVLNLSQNEVIVGNQNFTIKNLQVNNATYLILPNPDVLDYQISFSSFLKLVCKNVALLQLRFIETQFDSSLLNVQSNLASFNDFNIISFQQSLKFRSPQCIQLQIQNYLEMQQINYMNSTNLCTNIANSIQVYISNFNVTQNKLMMPQAIYLSTSILFISKITNIKIQNFKLVDNYPNFSLNSFLLLDNIQQFLISDSEFTSNSANNTSGGALTIQNDQDFYDVLNNEFQSNITNTKFINNSSPYNFAGALFINNVDMDIQSCSFISNYAQIGGAIRIVSANVVPLFYIKHLIHQSIDFKNNTANFYGNNIGFYPKEIRVYRNEQYTPKLTIENFRSGDSLKNLQIKFIDYEEHVIYLQDIQKKSIENVDKLFSYSLDIQADSIFIPNYQFYIEQSSRTYSLNATIISQPLSKQQITISTKQIFPFLVLDKQNQRINITNKQLNTQISIIARICLEGEVYSTQNEISVCEPCPEGKYSFTQPQLDDPETNQCKICPPFAKSCIGNTMKLKNGYWRQNDDSDIVYSCEQYFDNCRAEDSTSIKYCKQGYVGPLCSSCDIEGKTWGSKYARVSGIYCSSCKLYGIQIGMFIGFLILTVSYLLFLMKQNMSCTTKKIQAQYLKILGIIRFGKSAQFERNSILSKILMHYVQIFLIVLNGSQVPIPSFFSILQVGGDPVLNIYYSLDCLLQNFDIQIVFARIIWLIIFVVFLTLTGTFFCFFQYFLNKSQQKQFNYYLSFCSMAVKMVLIYTFPGLLSQITKTITCVTYDKGSYSLADLQFSCNESSYKKLSYYFVLPLFFILVLVIPLVYLLRIRRIINHPFRISLLKSFGFLFYDYKQNAYYWEILKLQLKALIIVSNTLLHSYLFNKLLISLVLIMVYIFLHLRVKPYIMYEFNHLDLMAHLVCNFTIVIILISISTPFPAVSYICFSIIVIINSLYIMRLFKTYFSGIIISYSQSNRSYIQKFLLVLKRFFPKFFNCINLQKQNSFKTLLLWQTLSKHVINKKEMLKDYKSIIFSVSQNNIQNEQNSINSNLICKNQNTSPVKKLHQLDQTNNDYFFNSLIQASKGKGCGISQSNSFSQIELSMQEPLDHNYPRFQFKKQIASISNINVQNLNQDSPKQNVNKVILQIQQNQNSTKNSDSDSDIHQCETRKQASTNVFSNATAFKGPLSINHSSNSLQSYSNFLSQKSIEKLSFQPNQTPRSLKKNYIQKTIMNNRIKGKKFSLRENDKEIPKVFQNETQETSNSNNSNQEKIKSFKKQKSFFSIANQEQIKYNSPLQNDCQTQVSVIMSPNQYIKSKTLKDDTFLRQQSEQDQNEIQNTVKILQAQKINNQLNQIPLFSTLPNQQNEIQIFNFSNLENSDFKCSTQQGKVEKQSQTLDSCENYQVGEEAPQKPQSQLNNPEQNDSNQQQYNLDNFSNIEIDNSNFKSITAVNANIPKESEKLVGIRQLANLVKSGSQ
ncbi:hypothetical protein ABPG73_005329 [Tetrahymena malaccensis]